jgi:hypothetical protein
MEELESGLVGSMPVRIDRRRGRTPIRDPQEESVFNQVQPTLNRVLS